ncbi:Ground-like domain-containing protein [Caenorhabditis elegans]|uniref:Ground-like domain-containing protein n=1 Tax=Caenorhabditis elegans TaxID=6239 RepID=Q9NA23_CAEEL|nr:Ground-like domain-containing protein [Caenorhabditis elegans]CAB76721.1 Ground-like domain-containing protein [Caenorhabditis elegans]|eukprot:NP_499020.1 GRound-Like (grd related) [Caenorhabditis elegans]
MYFSIFSVFIGLQITVEISGIQLIDGSTNVTVFHNDYTDSYSTSLIQNPNIRTKPIPRSRKDDDCSDELLRKVMNEHISDEGMTESKRAIHEAARRDFEGTWSIICAPCAFSYLAHAQDYCIHSRHGITCLLYRDG